MIREELQISMVNSETVKVSDSFKPFSFRSPFFPLSGILGGLVLQADLADAPVCH